MTQPVTPLCASGNLEIFYIFPSFLTARRGAYDDTGSPHPGNPFPRTQKHAARPKEAARIAREKRKERKSYTVSLTIPIISAMVSGVSALTE